jgi:hypothetical protein
MFEPRVRMTLRATLPLVTMAALAGAGCFRVDRTDVRVKDPHAVGVVGDADDRWLLPPGPGPAAAEVYKGLGGTDKLTRGAAGNIDYVAEHWALGTRVDTTQLLGTEGHTGWTGSMGQTRRFMDALAAGGEVRLHAVNYVNSTGPFGTCNGTVQGSCTSSPAVAMSLATDSRNIEELAVLRTSVHGFGAFEVVFGSLLTGTGILGGALGLSAQDAGTRAAVVGVSAGVLAIGGLILANGLWRVLTPDSHYVYRPHD